MVTTAMHTFLDSFDPFSTTVITIITSVVASSGFWAYLQRRAEKNDARTQLLLGLAHDRIIYLGMNYVERGWISKDEYEDFMKYLYSPYQHFGGNGLAERVFTQVAQLPIYKTDPSFAKHNPQDKDDK